MSERLAGFTVSIFGRMRELFSWPIIVANGFSGGDLITDATSHAGHWTTVDVVADAVFDTATVCNINGLAASGTTFPGGKQLFGHFTNIRLTSGAIIAYK